MPKAVIESLRGDFKGKASAVLYSAAIGLAFVHQAIAGAIYVLVVVMWLIPDRRIELALRRSRDGASRSTTEPGSA